MRQVTFMIFYDKAEALSYFEDNFPDKGDRLYCPLQNAYIQWVAYNPDGTLAFNVWEDDPVIYKPMAMPFLFDLKDAVGLPPFPSFME